MNNNNQARNKTPFPKLKKPLWMHLPPHLSYHLAEGVMRIKSLLPALKPDSAKKHFWHSVQWKGLHFRNPLGVAGGLDKSAKFLPFWWNIGAGFMEAGTITPLPQGPNPKPRLKRSFNELSLWNSMGFPNDGAKAIAKRLEKWKKTPHPAFPLFANIGPNRNTLHVDQDLLFCMSILAPHVDAFVINVSSPNTPGLTDFLQPDHLDKLLKQVNPALNNQKKPPPPLLLKWSPDVGRDVFLKSLDVALKNNISGHVLCNSSKLLGRSKENRYPKHGGVSGMPLAEKSKKLLQWTCEHLGEDKKNQLLISTGGAFNHEDIKERLSLGAQLVQTYSGLVFKGECIFQNPLL